MRFNLKKGLVATSLALAFSPFGAHAADIIQFDPDGTAATNGAFSVGAFDWAVASALSDNFSNAATGGSFNLYFHTALQGFQDLNGDPAGSPSGLNTNFELTVIGGFSEALVAAPTSSIFTKISNGADGVAGGGDDVYAQSQTAQFTLGTGSTNFIRMFYDDLTDGSGSKSSSLAGTGYDDGVRILDAIISSVTGAFTSTQQFIDADNSGTFTLGDTGLGVLLDNFGIDNWGGQLTVPGDGSTTLTAAIGFFNTNFFLTPIASILQTLDFTTQTNLPFNETNPSKCFDTDNTIGGGGVVGLTAANGGCDAAGGLTLGTINGGFLQGQSTDILLQADASNAFTAAAVPEPSALALLGIGLMGLAAARRRSGKAG